MYKMNNKIYSVIQKIFINYGSETDDNISCFNRISLNKDYKFIVNNKEVTEILNELEDYVNEDVCACLRFSILTISMIEDIIGKLKNYL